MNRLVSRSLVAALVFCFAFPPVVYGAGGAATSPPIVSVWDLIADTWNTLSTLWQEANNAPVPPDTQSTSDSDAGSHLDPFGKP